MTCELITGSAGTEHVSSADDGSMFASVFGEGRYAVKQGDNFAATMGSANSVTVGTGACFIDGRYFRVTSAETLTIDSGSQGTNRIDLVGVKYENNSGTETGTLAVVKGTAVSGEPSIPTYTDGNILEGATEAFFPLFSIQINGIVPNDPVALFHVMGGTVNCPWPIGAVLQMTNDTDPNQAYPGTVWTRIQGMFLLGSSSGHSLGTTGGAESVTLTTSNLPSHVHGLNNHTHTYSKAGTATGSTALTVNQIPSHNHGIYYLNRGVDSGSTWVIGASTNKDGTSNSSITNTGGGQGHTHSISGSSTNTGGNSNNTAATGSGTAVDKMPPFKVVNMWERTA